MTRSAIIQVKGLSKRYRIGGPQAQYLTLKESLSSLCTSPLRRLRNALSGRANAAVDLAQDLWALKDVSFSVDPGEALAIIGPNGSGKSTLLKILSRVTHPSEGEAILKGRLAALLEVGTGFHPELTGRENIFLNGSILGMSYREIVRNFDEIVAFAEIEKFLDTPVKYYSSGMYVRLAFSVAAHLTPEILIVDEVLAVGDVRFQEKCLGRMRDVAKSGRTILFVSHNTAAVRRLCSRAILLNHGQIQASGSTKDVISEYLSAEKHSSLHRKWTNGQQPQNDWLRLHEVKVLDGNDEIMSVLPISEAARIQITFEILKADATAVFSLSLISDDGTCVFSTLSNCEEALHGVPLSKGLYQSCCELPGNLLNDGNYWIHLVGLRSTWTCALTVDQILCIRAVDDGVLKGDYHGGYGGYLRPKLSWKTQTLEVPNTPALAEL